MNSKLLPRGETSATRQHRPTTSLVGWFTTASLVGATVLASSVDGIAPAPAASAGPVTAAVVYREPAVREAHGVVSEEIADRHSVEASIAAYQ